MEMVDFEDRETLKSQRKTPWSNGKNQQNVTTNSTFVWIVRSLRVRIVTELTKAPNFAQR